MPTVLNNKPLWFLKKLGLPVTNVKQINYQNHPDELITKILSRREGQLCSNGSLAINTGKFTGRSPKDRYIVKDESTAQSVNWNEVNQPVSQENFLKLHQQIIHYLSDKELWIRDSYACADLRYRLNLRIVTEAPWASLFGYNMFLRPDPDELECFHPEWVLLHAPGCLADPESSGIRQENFVVINFTCKMILIGGTSYTGEIKKGIFSVLNYLLPQKRVLSMHCSANVGRVGDTALFFGLSGTGKTTLSTDPHRRLIGDDEHGWSSDRIFNFEGGCYAKCIHLCKDKEPQIYQAIKEGALLENVGFFKGTDEVNYEDKSITENTRVSYPIFYLDNIMEPSSGGIPENIFFLTCDAYGVLPPIAKLTPAQAMYQFVSGYTAKVAGTEDGITEPSATFSACFAAPFLPLHPMRYAGLLGEKMKRHRVNCWFVNTGWTGGPYGTGNRIKLAYTRALVKAALEGALDHTSYQKDPVFGLATPQHCTVIPDNLLYPRNTWTDKSAYDKQSRKLAQMFIANFEKYADLAPREVLAAAPKI